jgi:metallo-beta-lactamase family protein
MSVSITFCGAAGCVTGSRYLVQSEQSNILIDCGLFQGEDAKRWNDLYSLPIALEEIDAVLLTHAHIDHIGLLPKYFIDGLGCPIWSTDGTRELMQILLNNSIRLQLKLGHLVLPDLDPDVDYGEVAAVLSGRLFSQTQTAPWNQRVEVAKNVWASWTPAGHLLGAAAITLEIEDQRITFSGDIGRYGLPVHPDPLGIDFGDTLIIESTYGAVRHPEEALGSQLAAAITTTAERNGVVVIPCFAAGKTQLLLRLLKTLEQERRIPELPIFVDSPVAIEATAAYLNHIDDCRDDIQAEFQRGDDPFQTALGHMVRKRSEVSWIHSLRDPMIVISASGFLEGGSILKHLRRRLAFANNTTLLLGYQPVGGRGAALLDGASELDLPGGSVKVAAESIEVSGFSAHADQQELLRWCSASRTAPRQVFVVHGESNDSKVFAETLTGSFGWRSEHAQHLQRAEVSRRC